MLIPAFRSASLNSASSRCAKSRRSATIFWIRSSPRCDRSSNPSRFSSTIGQVDFFGKLGDLRVQVALEFSQGLLGLLVEDAQRRAVR